MPEVRRIEVDVQPDAYLFAARDPAGHRVTMDLAAKAGGAGGRGFQARDLLLAALAGCSGGSFLRELTRLGQTVGACRVTVSGRLSDDRPSIFRQIDLVFTVSGRGLDEAAVRQAALACHGDCSVAATLAHVAEIRTDCRIERV